MIERAFEYVAEKEGIDVCQAGRNRKSPGPSYQNRHTGFSARGA